MKKFILLLLFFALCETATSQSKRPYTDGDLVYDDFKGDVLEIDSQSGMIYFDFDFIDQDQVIDGITFQYTTIKVMVNTAQSWLNFDNAPDNNIDYFQILFDIEHLYAEKYNSLVKNNPMEPQYTAAQDLIEEKNIVMEKYKLESDGGSRTDINQKWKKRIRKEISEIAYIDHKLSLISDYGFDAHFGMGYNILGNDLKQYYGNSLGLAFGINFNLKNIYLSFSGNLGIGNIDEAHTEYPQWEEGIHRNDVIWNMGIGRRFEIGKFYVSPFVGPSLINVYVNKMDYEEIYPETSDTKWRIGGGVLFDIPLSTNYGKSNNLTYAGYGTINTFTNHGLRISFHYVPKVDLFDAYEGDGKTIALSYYFYIGDLKIAN